MNENNDDEKNIGCIKIVNNIDDVLNYLLYNLLFHPMQKAAGRLCVDVSVINVLNLILLIFFIILQCSLLLYFNISVADILQRRPTYKYFF